MNEPENCPKSYQGVGDERCWNCDNILRCPYRVSIAEDEPFNLVTARGIVIRVRIIRDGEGFRLKVIRGNYVCVRNENPIHL